jgi:hypothetical protein
MNWDKLESLKRLPHAPRTLSDVGAHLGTFTQKSRHVFPECRPVLIEPNPHFQSALAATDAEVHASEVSIEEGDGELFLTQEWLQSTGASLDRKDTHVFHDEVVARHPVWRGAVKVEQANSALMPFATAGRFGQVLGCA